MEKTNKNVSIPLTCAECGSNNSVFICNITSRTRCRSCKAPVSPIAEPVCVDSASFMNFVGAATAPILAVFLDLRSGPCRQATPDLHALARDLAGRAIILKVDAGICPELAIAYGASSLPYFVLWSDSKPLLEHHGAVSEAEMKRWLKPMEEADSQGLRRMAKVLDGSARLVRAIRQGFAFGTF